MRPEQRKEIEEWVSQLRPGRFPSHDTARAALDVIDSQQAALDEQARELADLRAMLALAVRDDETGKAELGAAVERGQMVGEIERVAAEFHRKERESDPHGLNGAVAKLYDDLARHLRARGVCLSLPEVGEVERLRAENNRLRHRLNHQTEDDVEACRRGKHPADCGA